ncbi:hypothetical protein [Phaeacidiphilus oryzae]|uniref:hypothetical protein n=1 Tax=Phaeacidiphilus oryzae TaxID=348818 RepID=UPI00056A7627|nr:hypothetical protein [Phaeacidiphilus oryzae]
MSETRTHLVDTPHGEILVEDGGSPDGLGVVVHPGSPGSRLLSGAGVESAAESGLRLLSFDTATAARPTRG